MYHAPISRQLMQFNRPWIQTWPLFYNHPALSPAHSLRQIEAVKADWTWVELNPNQLKAIEWSTECDCMLKIFCESSVVLDYWT